MKYAEDNRLLRAKVQMYEENERKKTEVCGLGGGMQSRLSVTNTLCFTVDCISV